MVKLTLHSDNYIYVLTAKLFSLLNISLTGHNFRSLIAANFFKCLPNLQHPLQPVNFPYIFLNQDKIKMQHYTASIDKSFGILQQAQVSLIRLCCCHPHFRYAIFNLSQNAFRNKHGAENFWEVLGQDSHNQIIPDMGALRSYVYCISQKHTSSASEQQKWLINYRGAWNIVKCNEEDFQNWIFPSQPLNIDLMFIKMVSLSKVPKTLWS